MLHAPEDILRELIYGLNALLLSEHPHPPPGAAVTQRMFDILAVEGARLGAPALLTAWREEVDGDLDALLQEALVLIMEELDDQEDPYSASDILRLLQLEPFWRWAWDPWPDDEGLRTLSVEPLASVGSTLPLGLRPMLVDAIHQMEVGLYDAHHEQRSLYDQLDEDVFEAHIAEAVDRMDRAARSARIAGLTARLQASADAPLSVAAALRRIQGWKLAPGFDPSPDDDDGEWTLRILERLYRISWIVLRR